MGSERCAHTRLRTPMAVFGLLVWSSSAYAAEPSVWYRASEGCPDGAEFLQRLAQRGVQARLADVGDRVDFVVTLAAAGELSSGRLERQTSDGTIALRRVEDARCEAVADALALSLALTQAPEAADTTLAEPAPEPVAPALRAAAPVEKAAPAVPAVGTPPPTRDSSQVALGVASQASDVFEGPWLFSIGPFVELLAPGSFVLPRATLRLGLGGGFRLDAGASVRVWLVAARVEGCPAGFVWDAFELRPCVALDGGAVGASAASATDIGGWSTVAAHARAAWAPGRVALEAQVGGVVPITQYEVRATSDAAILEKTQAIGFSVGLGASYRFE